MFSRATIIGRAHRLRGHNLQDAAYYRSLPRGGGVGVVLDGCGSKFAAAGFDQPSRNEIGAQLLGQFIVDFLSHRAAPDGSTIDSCLMELHQAGRRFLDNLLQLMPDQSAAGRTDFIMTRLLCTVVGMVVLPDTAVCFWMGDGMLRVDDSVIELDEGNRPDYLAYALLPDAPPPPGFRTLHLHPRPQRIAVASDGWQADQLGELPAAASDLTLQRLVNQQGRQREYFNDDGAIVCWQQPPAEEPTHEQDRLS